MCSNNPLNVFKGSDAVAQFFDPDNSPPLPLVEVPAALNPLHENGVRIFAKLLTQLPAQNVKSLPALEMLRNEQNVRRQKIVEASSGSTVLSQAIIARALWGHEDVHAYVTNKKHPDSLKLLRFFGVNVNLYGGLAQQEPYDPKSIMSRLRAQAELDPSICYPGQYHNNHNWQSHMRWTGPQIYKQVPEINVFCSTVGTGGCAVGTGAYLKSQKQSVKVVGVCNAFGDPTPGPRHFPNFESSPFPWRETIDHFETVDSVDSYRTSMALSRHGIIAGPSSGEALHGLLAYLKKSHETGRLHELADPLSGEVCCVFVCADLPYQYMDLYYEKLTNDEFPQIHNQNLLKCDQNPYDERWFLTPSDAIQMFPIEGFCSTPESCFCALQECSLVSTPSSTVSFLSDSSSNLSDTSSSSIFSTPGHFSSSIENPQAMRVLDLRPQGLYEVSHLGNSYNLPLPLTSGDLFGNASAIEARWKELNAALDEPASTVETASKMLVVCQDGDSSRMATAILRAKGCIAFCVEGGYIAMQDLIARSQP